MTSSSLIAARWRSVAAMLASSCVAAGAALTVPATADAGLSPNGTFKIVNKQTGWCLGANAAFREAVLSPCGKRNRHQVWQTWQGGWTRTTIAGGLNKSRACMEAVFTLRLDTSCGSPTPDGSREWYVKAWRHWQGGWYQNLAPRNGVLHCLRPGRSIGRAKREVEWPPCPMKEQFNPSASWVWTKRGAAYGR